MTNIWEIIKIIYEPADGIGLTIFQWSLKTICIIALLRLFYKLMKACFTDDDGGYLPWWVWFH